MSETMDNQDQGQENRDNAQVTDLTALIAAVNELIADAATNRTELLALNTDIDNLRAAIVGITAKLDADGGVTDTNYASTLDPVAVTSGSPAAALTATTITATAVAGS